MSNRSHTYQKLIPSSELEVGMFVSKLDCPWEQTPFIFQGFLISNKDEIYQLQEHCQEVYVDIKQTLLTQKESLKEKVKKTEQKKKPNKPRYTDLVTFEKELSFAYDTYLFMNNRYKELLIEASSGKGLNSGDLFDLIRKCVKSLLRNTGALTWLTQIRNKDAYHFEHAIRVAITAIAFGKELELPVRDLEILGICGLLHDIGKATIPVDIVNKEGRLNAEEFKRMRTHPEEGKRLLEMLNVPIQEAIDVAYSHHERIDGKGYPLGITGEKIPYFAKIIAITDSFDAITSHRNYRKGISSPEALSVIYDERGLHYDRELAERFVKFIGIYPLGHIAELNTGHLAIILSNTQQNKLKPKLLLITSPNKEPIPERIINLSKTDTLKNGIQLRIKDIHNDGAFGIKLQFYLEKALALWSSPPI
ncbi:HD-GYP domain-containing protein [Litoribacillus peritrichatus]|uniref:Cyclic di-GMP phosphodiesterase n=1 Tax=Litoribacillus peritrichatus TaxID=718191 RepID=A0ABP7M209_9GAMM